MIELTKINSVYMSVNCDDLGILKDLESFFSFYVDGYQFMPSYKNRIWDGKLKLFNAIDRSLYTGLLSYVEWFCEHNEYELIVGEGVSLKEKINPKELYNWMTNLNMQAHGKPIKAMTHQMIGLHHILENKRVLIQSPTSSGKSAIIYMLTRRILEDEEGQIFVIVPTVSLVTQMYNDFIDYATESDFDIESTVHKISAGIEKTTNKQVIISTWQSISKMPIDYFSSASTLILDEAHLAAGTSLQGIGKKTINAKYRIGLTGTTHTGKANIMQIEGITGPKKELITTKQLIDKGQVAGINIEVVLMKYREELCKGARTLDYQQETKAIAEYKKRNNVVCDIAAKENNNTLLLFNTIKHGKYLYDRLKSTYPDRNIYYIDGSIDKDIREEIRVGFEQEDNAVLVASFATFGTGLSVKKLHTIAFAATSKSRIRVLQAIGRGLRLHSSKSKMLLLDFTDDMSYKKSRNYSLKHFLARQEFYNEQQFDYTFRKISIDEYQL